MNTLTNDQKIAIQFFQQNEQTVQYFGLTHLADREERLLFRKGKKLIESALTVKSKASKNHVKWTDEEYDKIAECYHLFEGDRPAIVKEFLTFSTRHSDSAVDIAAQSCKALDTKYAQTGMTDYAVGLLNALNAITPNRFKSTR